MNMEMPLAGLNVLVVSDDFYRAWDTIETLEEAGACVQGPFRGADGALHANRRSVPPCVVIDLNQGFGADFEIARTLASVGVPSILVIGDDDISIPADLAGLQRLQKPVSKGMLAAAVAALLS
jgi:FixJ family two-component response regulator